MLAALLAVQSTVAFAGGKDPIEYLDEQTAATVTAVYQPLVFARERRDVAANLRDYVTLVAAAVNRSGKVSYVLIAYYWSTVDARLGGEAPATDTLLIAADDRRIEFKKSGNGAREQGIAVPVHAPKNHDTTPVVYRTDLDTLRYLAAARHLEIRLGSDDLAPVYEIWDDERDELAAFVAFMNGER